VWVSVVMTMTSPVDVSWYPTVFIDGSDSEDDVLAVGAFHHVGTRTALSCAAIPLAHVST